MQSRLVRWVAYMLLVAVVVVTSCQAMAALPLAGGAIGSMAASQARR